MIHFPILKSTNSNSILEFFHFDMDALAGTWKKENVIMRDCLKINVFVEGSFSVFSDEMLHYPIYGDIFLLPPMKMHYGQITKQMHINYYHRQSGTVACAACHGYTLHLGTRYYKILVLPLQHSRRSGFYSGKTAAHHRHAA